MEKCYARLFCTIVFEQSLFQNGKNCFPIFFRAGAEPFLGVANLFGGEQPFLGFCKFFGLKLLVFALYSSFTMAMGMQVRIHGLVNKPKFNGQYAIVKSREDVRHRHMVQLQTQDGSLTNTQLSVDIHNLQTVSLVPPQGAQLRDFLAHWAGQCELNDNLGFKAADFHVFKYLRRKAIENHLGKFKKQRAGPGWIYYSPSRA